MTQFFTCVYKRVNVKTNSVTRLPMQHPKIQSVLLKYLKIWLTAHIFSCYQEWRTIKITYFQITLQTTHIHPTEIFLCIHIQVQRKLPLITNFHKSSIDSSKAIHQSKSMSTPASDNSYLYRVTLDLRTHKLNPTDSEIKDTGASVSHTYRKNYVWAPKRLAKPIFIL